MSNANTSLFQGLTGFIFSDPNLARSLARYANAFACSWNVSTLPGWASRGGLPAALAVDIDLSDRRAIGRYREFVSRAGLRTIPAVFFVDVGRRAFADTAQANALGARFTISRPFDPGRALMALAGLESIKIAENGQSDASDAIITASVGAAMAGLQSAFASLMKGEKLDTALLSSAVDRTLAGIAEAGAAAWLDSVRAHHQGTFQHCLLVTGTAAMLAQASGWRGGNSREFTLAALLHDIGKVEVPASILDKPGRLTPQEMSVMRRHPATAEAYLRRHSRLPSEIIDAVAYHHEYLDGSGYPYGLKAESLTEMTRGLTCCDIYAALTERRSYKPPMSPEEAMAILRSMAVAGKLDPRHVELLAEAVADAAMTAAPAPATRLAAAG